MLLPKAKFREAVLQILYSWEVTSSQGEDLLILLMEQLKTTKKNMKEAEVRAGQVWEKKDLLDTKIQAASDAYALERISKVDLAILRLGIFELFFDEEIPEKVALAEGIRLSRKFSSPEAADFVQAILNEVLKNASFV
jgi:N utilization substance protein B